MIDLDSLKALYPSPMSVLEWWHEGQIPKQSAEAYCVGGAFTRVLGYPAGFPSQDMLRRALKEANPRLTPGQARVYAEGIADANDCKLFEQAWMILEKALEA